MQPFRYHVFACDQRKPEGQPCCSARGSLAVIEALRREIATRGLAEVVQVTTSGSVGLCERGPNLVVYPDGVWYSGVTPADVPELVTRHFVEGRPLERLMNRDVDAVRREIADNRDKALATMKARDAAGAVPDELMDTVRGYQPSRVVLTALELDVFSVVARASPATAAAVAGALGTDVRATEMLLNALVALGLSTKKDGAFANGPFATRWLVAGAKDDARLALRHNSSLWGTWSTLTDCVRAGRRVQPARDPAAADAFTEPFIAAMHKNAALRAPLVVKAAGAGRARRMLDVGGGSGAYSIAFAREVPGLVADILDLASVVPIAERHVREAGLAERVRTRVGDLRADDLGSGYDLVLLSAICHMLGPDEVQDLFRRVLRATAPRGQVVIQDHVMSADKTAPRAGALFALNMLVGTAAGGTYSEDEYRRWLEAAGFAEVRHVPLPGPNDLMIARRP